MQLDNDEYKVLTEKNYREALKVLIRKRGQTWGGISKLARDSDCQRSHISRVISGKLHFTPDQALAIAASFGFSENTTEYFLTKVDMERAGTRALRNRLQKRLREIETKIENLATKMQRPTFTAREVEVTYFSNWLYCALHVLSSIPKYRTAGAMAERLGTPEAVILLILEQMKNLNLLELKNNQWIFKGGSIHMGKDQPLTVFHHANWRQRALVSIQNQSLDDIHFTNVQSISSADFGRLKRIVLETIEACKKVADPSTEEEAFCLTLDLFRI